MEDVTVALVSMRSRPAEPTENVEKHLAWIEKAKAAGASICLFPEMSVTGFSYDSRAVFHASEPVRGASRDRVVEMAREHDLTVGFGLAGRNNRDLVSNSYVFVSPEGYLGHYSKTHIPIAEYAYETPGDDFTVVDLGPLRMGVNICFDNWFCEAGRLSFLNGAEAILAPFYMGGPYENWKKLAMINFPAVAWQNGVYHITINACGGVEEKGMSYNGPPLLMVFNPLGELEAEGDSESDEEQMLVHTLKADTLHERRSQGHFHPKYRRPSIYGGAARGAQCLLRRQGDGVTP